MKPLRKLTLSRKSSKQSMRGGGDRDRDREQTPPVPPLPGSGASTGSTTPPIASAKSPSTKSRPPESNSAGTAAIGSLTPDAKSRDGSIRKKNAPSSFNGVGAGNWPDQRNDTSEDESGRRRKSSLASKGKRRLSAIFNSGSSKNLAAQARGSSAEPEQTPSGAVTPVTPNGNGHSNGHRNGNGNGYGYTPSVDSFKPLPDPIDNEDPHPGLGISLNGSTSSQSSTDRALPALPPAPVVAAPSPGAITAAVAQLKVNGDGMVNTPTRSDGSGFPFDSSSPARGLSQPPSAFDSGAPSPSRQAKVNNLYSQWADDSDDETVDGDGYLTPSEGLSEVEEEDEENEGAVKAATNKLANRLAAPTTNGSGYSSSLALSMAPSTATGVSSSGPKVRRSNAGAAKVRSQHSIKRGDPNAIDQSSLLANDLDICRKALALFLESKMREAEQLLVDNDPQANHLYLQLGHGLIESLKGLMTFDSEDLLSALEITKGTSHTASVLRRPTESMFSKIGGLVRSGHGVARIKAMSVLERHAELTYAETMLIKAIIAIVAGGDWLGLIKEALNMRSAHGIYRTLQQYLDEMDKNGYNDDIDMDFRSGVLLGTGTSSLMLSMLPARVLKIAEVFGYAGDRTLALDTLMSAGGWTPGSAIPAYNEDNEGIRRPICDMILLTFHLVISALMPVSGVDVETAKNILDYNMKRYPNGIFFLYFKARLLTNEGEPEMANDSLQKALELDLEYVQLQHMCLWDYGCNYLQLTNWEGARQCFDILRQESNWSRAVYTYAMAVNVMELSDDPAFPESTPEVAVELLLQMPKLVKKMAGKSLPIEKFTARKARKFIGQGNRLFLPAMELAYVFGSLGHTPRRLLVRHWLPHINAELARLEASTPETWYSGTEYWDDYVLGHFLRGMVQGVAVYQPVEASEAARAAQPGEPTNEELDAGSEADFKAVIAAAPNVRLDHYLLFHNHYELGRLYAKRGDVANARANFEVVINNKLPQPNLHSGPKAGKYSLEGALQIKVHAAQQALTDGSATKGHSSIKSGKSGKGGKH